MADFEEMDTINPIFDLVVFRPIKDITSGREILPVTYDLGLDFHPHTNDWVGLFYSGWSSVKDYLEYQWAPMLPHNLNTVHRRRRSVLFQISNFAVSFVKSNFTHVYDVPHRYCLQNFFKISINFFYNITECI